MRQYDPGCANNLIFIRHFRDSNFPAVMVLLMLITGEVKLKAKKEVLNESAAAELAAMYSLYKVATTHERAVRAQSQRAVDYY